MNGWLNPFTIGLGPLLVGWSVRMLRNYGRNTYSLRSGESQRFDVFRKTGNGIMGLGFLLWAWGGFQWLRLPYPEEALSAISTKRGVTLPVIEVDDKKCKKLMKKLCRSATKESPDAKTGCRIDPKAWQGTQAGAESTPYGAPTPLDKRSLGYVVLDGELVYRPWRGACQLHATKVETATHLDLPLAQGNEPMVEYNCFFDWEICQ
ncbi:hypothetical protein [Candidatus Magnetaquiglobus chichijimensis]